MKELQNDRSNKEPITTREVIETILVVAAIFVIGYFMIAVGSILDNPQ